MSFFKGGCSAGAPLHSEYEMSNALSHKQIVTVVSQEWEVGFWNKHKKSRENSIPFPCMYRGEPYWRGIVPSHKTPLFDDETFIADMDCKIRVVKSKDVKAPTTKEYNSFFKHLVDANMYKIAPESDSWLWTKLVKTPIPHP